MPAIKVIITSKMNLQTKYGNKFLAVDKLLNDLIKSDQKNGLTTHVIYIDDVESTAAIGIQAVRSVTRPAAKKIVDNIYKKLNPAYIVLFGSQDIFPFQEIENPINKNGDEDEDKAIPSDLPYACDKAYSTNIASFIGPTRVVGRIPDVPGRADMAYLKTVFNTIIKHKKVESEKLMEYFAITTEVWKKSTQTSLSNMFGNSSKLKISPSQNTPHSNEDLNR